MNEQRVGLVIRTVFNNQGWSGPCKSPLNDRRCFKCSEGGSLWINDMKAIGEDEDGFCKGEVKDYPLSKIGATWCWEQELCKKYFWGNIKGKWRYVTEGMPVYFVYSEWDNSVTLWGHSSIRRIVNETDEEHDYPTIYFEPFEQLPPEKWVKGLTGEDITGASWRQGFYRYLDEAREVYMNSLIYGKAKPTPAIPVPSGDYESFSFSLRKDIKEKIQKIALNEGREVDDLIREALAKLIRERK